MVVAPLQRTVWTARQLPVSDNSDIQNLVNALTDTFQSLSKGLSSFSNVQTDPQFNPPDKPRAGMVAYADGVHWNPGSGEGFYGFSQGVWTLLGGVGGSFSPRTVSSGPFTILAGDSFVVIKNSTAAPITITLPAASTKNFPVTVKDGLGNFGAHFATVTPSGGDTIDGSTSFVMAINWQGLTFNPISGGYLISG